MPDPRQQARAATLRQLHDRRSILLLPNAWDAGTAALCARHGFPAIGTTSGGLAWALGYPDGEQAPLREVLAVVARMVRAVDVPVTVDLETGYGDESAAVAESVRALLTTGAAGLNLEDGMPGHGPLRRIEEAAARIAAARAAANEAGIALVINARVDHWMQEQSDPAAPLADAIARARAYLAAGADCIYPIGLRDTDTLRRFIQAIDAPVNVAAGAGMPALPELARLGVARVSTATRLSTIALDAVDRALRTMRETGSFESLASQFTYADAQALFEP